MGYPMADAVRGVVNADEVLHRLHVEPGAVDDALFHAENDDARELMWRAIAPRALHVQLGRARLPDTLWDTIRTLMSGTPVKSCSQLLRIASLPVKPPWGGQASH